ncbi:glycosyltransferase family 4 protein [Lacticigenium naphthae]|uniref:glycosyltransferase family 4 protein n=1 Tax=Lacticigenium naphthae TaxID=515351 RepID=UPI0005518D1E|nr:MraY family glycosyltransferase [Lacticigenium naphthae]
MFFVLIMCVFTMVISLIVTPLVKKLAVTVGAVDNPNKRRVNIKPMPTIGGLAIFISFFISAFFLQPLSTQTVLPVFIASSFIIVTGLIDDIKEISPLAKILGIVIAATIIYYFTDIKLEMITIPIFGEIHFGVLSLPMTLIWILGITNAINLVDGLDGLASGISIIALSTMGIIGFFFLGFENVEISIMLFTLVAAIVGFWPYNFFPASIFLGDTGALFLGFMIAVFSLNGLKNVTFISLVIPIVILGIPITDTLYAIIRRKLKKLPISAADKHHIHHRLMGLGLSHRQTVLAIYSLGIIFSIIALLYKMSTFWGTIILSIGVIVGVEIFVEVIGLIDPGRTPFLNFVKKLFKKAKSDEKPNK